MKNSLKVLIALAFSTIFYKAHALETTQITRELIITTSNSTTVTIGQNFYTVSKNRTHIHINSTNTNDNPCTIATDPFEDVIRGKINVETAGDNEIIIWGIQSQEINENITSTYYAFLSVDLRGCSYKSISIPKSDDAAIPKNFLPRLVRYDNDRMGRGYDIFFPSLKTCTPCRFYVNGNEEYFPIDIDPKTSTSENQSDTRFYIGWMNPNYFYVRNFNRDKSVLKYLKSEGSQSYQIIKEKYLNYSVETIAVRKGKINNVGICSKIKRNHDLPHGYDEIRCERFNSKLQSVVSIIIPTPEKEVSSVSLQFDYQGNFYISFAEGNELRVYVYDMDGQHLQSFNLGEVDERFRSFSTDLSNSKYPNWDVHGFLTSFGEYCIIIEQMNVEVYAKALHVVKCIDVTKFLQ